MVGCAKSFDPDAADSAVHASMTTALSESPYPPHTATQPTRTHPQPGAVHEVDQRRGSESPLSTALFCYTTLSSQSHTSQALNIRSQRGHVRSAWHAQQVEGACEAYSDGCSEYGSHSLSTDSPAPGDTA